MVRRFFSLTFSEFFLRGSKFLFFITIANLFSQNALYEYGYFTALFSIIFVFSDFGLQTYLTTLLAKSKSTKTFLFFANASFFRIFSFLLFSLPVLVYYTFSQNEFFIYIFLLFLADSFFALHFAYLRALHDSFSESLIKLAIAFIYILAIILAFLTDLLHVSFICLSTFYLIFALFHSKFIKAKYIKFFILKPKFSSIKNLIFQTLTILIGGVATMVYLRADILMLNWMDSEASVALYTIASRVLELSLVIPMVISAIILPKLATSSQENIKIAILKQFFIGLFVLSIFLIFSNLIIGILFEKYTNSVQILNILLLSIPIMLVNNYIFSYFIAKDKAKYYALITSIIATLNILANYLTIPTYGYIGASWATVFTEFLGLILGFYLLKRIVLC